MHEKHKIEFAIATLFINTQKDPTQIAGYAPVNRNTKTSGYVPVCLLNEIVD